MSYYHISRAGKLLSVTTELGLTVVQRPGIDRSTILRVVRPVGHFVDGQLVAVHNARAWFIHVLGESLPHQGRAFEDGILVDTAFSIPGVPPVSIGLRLMRAIGRIRAARRVALEDVIISGRGARILATAPDGAEYQAEQFPFDTLRAVNFYGPRE